MNLRVLHSSFDVRYYVRWLLQLSNVGLFAQLFFCCCCCGEYCLIDLFPSPLLQMDFPVAAAVMPFAVLKRLIGFVPSVTR
jgi:hypothetical protein